MDTPNNGNGQRFMADVRPYRPYSKRPALNDKSLPIGLKGDNLFTKVRLKTYDASLDYPETSHFLSFGNGKSTTFCKVTTDDLLELVRFIQDWLVENEGLRPTYEAQEARVGQSLNYYRQLQQVKDIQAMGNLDTVDHSLDFVGDREVL